LRERPRDTVTVASFVGKNTSGLTRREGEVMDALTDAWNANLELEDIRRSV
jgi:hypothetical protein